MHNKAQCWYEHRRYPGKTISGNSKGHKRGKKKTCQHLHILTKRNTGRVNQKTVKFVLQGMELGDKRNT